jgi:hypothetical protein
VHKGCSSSLEQQDRHVDLAKHGSEEDERENGREGTAHLPALFIGISCVKNSPSTSLSGVGTKTGNRATELR